MPSCCCVCRAFRRVDSSFMSASTRRPTPLSIESIRLETKSSCIRDALVDGAEVRSASVICVSIESTTRIMSSTWASVVVALRLMPVPEACVPVVEPVSIRSSYGQWSWLRSDPERWHRYLGEDGRGFRWPHRSAWSRWC